MTTTATKPAIPTTDRIYNFSPGPAVLPLPVLEQARDEMLSLAGSGMSILEVSHRGPEFVPILQSAKTRIRQLLSVPDNYQIVFLQGGSRLQFSMVPLNLAADKASTANYIITGTWGQKAAEESQKVSNTHIAYDGKSHNFNRIPTPDEIQLSDNAAFVHFTSNETIQGVQFLDEPQIGNVPLVCDASSDFMCRPLDISKYGLIYACAQKNAGPAGVTVVIIRDDLLQRSSDALPGYLNYQLHAEEDSLYNTAPTFAIYIVELVAKWLQEEVGGLDRMFAINKEKSQLLYDAIDTSRGFYTPHAAPNSRSLMNITFTLPNEELQTKFLSQAKALKLCNLKGHRSVGGIRASIYNAMPTEGVKQLAEFMRDFSSKQSS